MTSAKMTGEKMRDADAFAQASVGE